MKRFACWRGVRRFVPDDSQLLALLGSAYLKKKDTLRATELLERAVELKPQANDMRTQLAMVRLAVGRGDAAIQELEKNPCGSIPLRPRPQPSLA